MGGHDPLRGTGKIRDDKEVIKSNSFRGQDRIKEQPNQASKIREVNHLEKEVRPSQYINTGFKSKKKKVLKRELAYKKINQDHNGRRNQDSIRDEKKQDHLKGHLNGKRNLDNISDDKKQDRINAESNRKPVNHASSQISANIKYSSSPRASTGHAESMILAKKDFKRAIKSDSRHETHISMILGQTEKARFSENVTKQLTGERRESPTKNSKLKDQRLVGANGESTIRDHFNNSGDRRSNYDRGSTNDQEAHKSDSFRKRNYRPQSKKNEKKERIESHLIDSKRTGQSVGKKTKEK